MKAVAGLINTLILLGSFCWVGLRKIWRSKEQPPDVWPFDSFQLLTVKFNSESRIKIFDALYGHVVVLNCWLDFSRNR